MIAPLVVVPALLLAPTEDELRLFRTGGHNAETLATLMFAGRIGVAPSDARRRLKEEAPRVHPHQH